MFVKFKKLSKKEEADIKREFLNDFKVMFDWGQDDYRDHQLNHCCSALVIGGWQGFAHDDLRKYKDDIVKLLKKIEKDHWQEYGVVITSINQLQYKFVAPILKGLSFGTPKKGIGRHQRMVYVYSRPVKKNRNH